MIHAPISTAAPFTIARTWRQPLSADRGTDKDAGCVYRHIRVCSYTCVHTHTVKHCSAIKKNEIMLFVAICVDLEMVMVSEVRQTEKDT